MGSRKLVRDFFLSKQLLSLQLNSFQASNTRLRLLSENGLSGSRGFSVFNEFSKKVKGEVKSNQDFQKTVKEFKEKAGELKEAKEELKVRTKQTAEQLYKHADSVWTEAEATAKKVTANVKEKISAASEEVKETLGIKQQESSGSSGTSAKSDAAAKEGDSSTSGKENSQQSETVDAKESLFGRFKSGFSSTSPGVSAAFQKLKDAKVIDLAKKGYDTVKDELSGNPAKRRHVQAEASSTSTGERSTRTDIVVVPTKQSKWGKKWEAFKTKMQGHRVFKRISGISEPVVTKGQEFAEDMRERWETSDHPVVHKIQDINETVFGETTAALCFKEIRRRDPSFSLPEFAVEVQEMIKPTLNAYIKGDAETLKKNCSPEVIERCKAEHRAYEGQGIFFDNKILHISEVEIRETKLMGSTPIIIVAFQTQQIYCVRDRHGAITEGGKDTIHTVYYAWAMQQMDVEELGEGALYPVWRLREMQQLGVQALI
ncbi:mitochondrial import inner membrane translocase subunit TIM44-2-like [Macadamia integrifolia]|uniref:mitochondrial import inner membrane translocase subunit TIM44-2-like n=1 Tax=Macadamia integrifolia TaxID=60698 RepID=UPI001C4F7C26|nr:mitochondrial import inner membrane translocase subunit TIM44-2-like [Macadamia integrifolia]